MKYNAINVKYNQPQVKYNGAFIVTGVDYSNLTTISTSSIEVISSGLMSFSIINSTGISSVGIEKVSEENYVEASTNIVLSGSGAVSVDSLEEEAYLAEIKVINISTMGTS